MGFNMKEGGCLDDIMYILIRDEDFYIDDYDFPKEDMLLCESICIRINYIRQLYREYKSIYSDAVVFEDETLTSYYHRIQQIAPNFIIEGLHKYPSNDNRL